jgi:hypothetical protein
MFGFVSTGCRARHLGLVLAPAQFGVHHLQEFAVAEFRLRLVQVKSHNPLSRGNPPRSNY